MYLINLLRRPLVTLEFPAHTLLVVSARDPFTRARSTRQIYYVPNTDVCCVVTSSYGQACGRRQQWRGKTNNYELLRPRNISVKKWKRLTLLGSLIHT